MNDVITRFLLTGEGMEPITAATIVELVARGWEERELLQAQAGGLLYCRERDSLFSAPEQF